MICEYVRPYFILKQPVLSPHQPVYVNCVTIPTTLLKVQTYPQDLGVINTDGQI